MDVKAALEAQLKTLSDDAQINLTYEDMQLAVYNVCKEAYKTENLVVQDFGSYQEKDGYDHIRFVVRVKDSEGKWHTIEDVVLVGTWNGFIKQGVVYEVELGHTMYGASGKDPEHN